MDTDSNNEILDGRKNSAAIKDDVAIEVREFTKKTGIQPALTVILVGEDPASQVYVKNKEKGCGLVGIKSDIIRHSADFSEKELLAEIESLNRDKKIHGILVQLPLPKHINENLIIEAISPEKDVDGFHPLNIGKMVAGNENVLLPCTPAGVIEMLKRENIEMSGKDVVVIGRSNIVGKPLSQLFIQNNATVTTCHSRTKDIEKYTKDADIIAVAVGRPRFFDSKFLSEHKKPVIIDVGIHKIDGKLCGDVDFDDVKGKVSKITPVPGGVGPLTIAMLLKNTITATKIQASSK